ncbi:MAG: hypothetical protein QOF67_803 [Mycobacterium sp.]|nr:hypothetical protein [Mycobacterium sp.]
MIPNRKNIDHQCGHVVAAAVADRSGDQTLGGDVRIGGRPQHVCDEPIVQLPCQTVRTDEDPVTRSHRQHRDVGRVLRRTEECTGQQVAAGCDAPADGAIAPASISSRTMVWSMVSCRKASESSR